MTEERVANKNMQKARRIVAYFLLKFTGLRVANLSLLTVQHVDELVTKGKTTIPLIKCEGQRLKLRLLKNQRAFFQRRKGDLVKKRHNLKSTKMLNL